MTAVKRRFRLRYRVRQFFPMARTFLVAVRVCEGCGAESGADSRAACPRCDRPLRDVQKATA